MEVGKFWFMTKVFVVLFVSSDGAANTIQSCQTSGSTKCASEAVSGNALLQTMTEESKTMKDGKGGSLKKKEGSSKKKGGNKGESPTTPPIDTTNGGEGGSSATPIDSPATTPGIDTPATTPQIDTPDTTKEPARCLERPGSNQECSGKDMAACFGLMNESKCIWAIPSKLEACADTTADQWERENDEAIQTVKCSSCVEEEDDHGCRIHRSRRHFCTEGWTRENCWMSCCLLGEYSDREIENNFYGRR